jgi:glucan 1,3-beta-glucosidase
MAERPFSVVSSQSLALAANTPLPLDDDASSMHEPRPAYLSDGTGIAPLSTESPRDSYLHSSLHDTESGVLLTTKNEGVVEEDAATPAEDAEKPQSKRRRPLLVILLACLALIVLILAVVLPVYFTVIKPRSRLSASSSSDPAATGTSSGGGGSTSPPVAKDPVTGGDGSTIRLANGSTFTYQNSFGGICEYPLFLFSRVIASGYSPERFLVKI